jgi:hypothetical protein
VIVIDDQANFMTDAEAKIGNETRNDKDFAIIKDALPVSSSAAISSELEPEVSTNTSSSATELESQIGLFGTPLKRIATKAPATVEALDIQHGLNAQLLTNSFFIHGMIAGLYRPTKSETADATKFSETVANAVKVSEKSDAVIIDWLLNGKDPSLAKEILAGILASDYSSGGRLRTIVVYTGEKNLKDRRDELLDFLRAKRILISQSNSTVTFSSEGDFSITAANVRIAFYSKSIEGNSGPPERVKLESDLPEVLIEELLNYANGLMPSFAMKAAAVLRDNTHHLLTRFPADLDGAYLAHRVLIPDADDGEPFMIDNLLSIIKNKLSTERVDKEMLGRSAISAMMDKNTDIAFSLEKENSSVPVTFGELEESVLQGKEKFQTLVAEKSGKKINEKIIFDAATLVAKSKQNLYNFSILTSFRRSFIDVGGSVNAHAPYLSQGTLLALVVGKEPNVTYEYLLCVTPKCDCVRISPVAGGGGSRTFSFVRLAEVENKYDLVAAHDGVYKTLRTNNKFHEMQNISFDADPKLQRVISTYDVKSNFFSFKENDKVYHWVGDLKDLHMQAKVSNLVGNLNRVGYDEFDWLRQKIKY